MLFELLEARKRQIAQQYHHVRRKAAKDNEPFNISYSEWMGLWRRQPDPTEPGRISRANPDRPWSVANCLYEQRAETGQPQLIYQGVRTLTVAEWVREIRAKR